MLVDDNPANLDVLVEALEREGYEILVATNGAEALDVARQASPDLIMLDINMPEMDGYEVCRQLKLDDRTQAIPILFISALGEVLDKVKAFGAGGVDYITKPFQIEEVLARMQTHLTLRWLQEHLQTTNLELKEKNEALKNTLNQIREMQTQLIMQEKMASLGDLVAGVAHEMNTPLGAISSMQDTLIRATDKLKQTLETTFPGEYKDNRAIQSVFKVIADAGRVMASGAERVGSIVDSLRNFARLDEAEFQVVDLRVGIDSVLTLLQNRIGENITVVKKYGDIPPIYCSPGQMNQVFMHLLKNALQAIEKTGEITVSTFEADDKVYVQISDTGVGIPPAQLEHIFDFDFHATHRRVKMGFGLSTDFRIIQDHKGEIQVESEVGKGTEVTISLPRRESDRM